MLNVVRETKDWAMELVIRENSDETEAQARLRFGDVEMAGSGHARRNPHDPCRPRVGEELAVARALSDLSEQLMGAALREIAEPGGPTAHDRETDAARAGWYPDPDDRYEQRYFDGQAWTDRTRSAGPIQSPS
jgi:hypothetical protein